VHAIPENRFVLGSFIFGEIPSILNLHTLTLLGSLMDDCSEVLISKLCICIESSSTGMSYQVTLSIIGISRFFLHLNHSCTRWSYDIVPLNNILFLIHRTILLRKVLGMRLNDLTLSLNLDYLLISFGYLLFWINAFFLHIQNFHLF
jgi:hypothetical protein